MTDQTQFLQVVDADEAHARWWSAVRPTPLTTELLALADLRARILAEPVVAACDVPGFDRSNVDGYAVQAADTYGASESTPTRLRLHALVLASGVAPDIDLRPGEAVTIATGGVVPRGADAVVMVEDCDREDDILLVRRPVVPGGMISFAGSDITRGEVVLRPGVALGPRETGVLAAIGRANARVHRRPRVGVLSTGDEIAAPGQPLLLGQVHDCNQTLLADACAELGADVVRLGIAPDRAEALRAALHSALHEHAVDLLLLSGGTSKGAGDLSFRAVADLPGVDPDTPAIRVHGVALKPGKPLCLAATRVGERRVAIAVLPGFPTSALFTFHEFVRPLLRALAGLPPAPADAVPATLAHDLASERGRREYVLVQLLAGPEGHVPADMSEQPLPIALPIGKGSGSVTAFCRADGFLAVPRQHERVDAGERVLVQRTAQNHRPPDLLIVGSHCTGLELLADRLHAAGLRVQLIAQGSHGGLTAAARGHCDVAPIHLLDPATGVYNHPFLPPRCSLVRGYARMQGLVVRADDHRLALLPSGTLPARVLDPDLRMVNRNRGSGTRVLIDELIAPHRPHRPAGYTHEARSHQGVVACVAQARADWGVAIASVVGPALRFTPIREERYDFVIPDFRRPRPAVQEFLKILADPEARAALVAAGFTP